MSESSGASPRPQRSRGEGGLIRHTKPCKDFNTHGLGTGDRGRSIRYRNLRAIVTVVPVATKFVTATNPPPTHTLFVADCGTMRFKKFLLDDSLGLNGRLIASARQCWGFRCRKLSYFLGIHLKISSTSKINVPIKIGVRAFLINKCAIVFIFGIIRFHMISTGKS